MPDEKTVTEYRICGERKGDPWEGSWRELPTAPGDLLRIRRRAADCEAFSDSVRVELREVTYGSVREWGDVPSGGETDA